MEGKPNAVDKSHTLWDMKISGKLTFNLFNLPLPQPNETVSSLHISWLIHRCSLPLAHPEIGSITVAITATYLLKFGAFDLTNYMVLDVQISKNMIKT